MRAWISSTGTAGLAEATDHDAGTVGDVRDRLGWVEHPLVDHWQPVNPGTGLGRFFGALPDSVTLV